MKEKRNITIIDKKQIPSEEPARQYYFMDIAKKYVAGQQLLFQLQTPLRQLGNTLVRKLELLLQLGNVRLQDSRGHGGIVVHNGILLFLILRSAAPPQPEHSEYQCRGV